MVPGGEQQFVCGGDVFSGHLVYPQLQAREPAACAYLRLVRRSRTILRLRGNCDINILPSMEREQDLTPQEREHQFQQALAAEATDLFTQLEPGDNHFMTLPDAVLGNRVGWTFTPAKENEVLGRLQACYRAIEEHGAAIESFAIVHVSVDVPINDEAHSQRVQTQLEPRVLLFLYKPTHEQVQKWREREERPLPKNFP